MYYDFKFSKCAILYFYIYQADVSRKAEFIAQDLQPVFEQCVYECLLSDTSDHEKRLQDLLYKHYMVRKTIFRGASLQKEGWTEKMNCLNELIKTLDSFKLEETKSGKYIIVLIFIFKYILFLKNAEDFYKQSLKNFNKLYTDASFPKIKGNSSFTLKKKK